MFHRVQPPEAHAFAPNAALSITPQFLDTVVLELHAAGFEIVPLDAVAERLHAPAKSPFAVLTFDDGYRDNALHAWPVLRRHRAPWTVFVVNDYAEGEGQLWWVDLEEALRRLKRVSVLVDGEVVELPAGTVAEKEKAFAELLARLRYGPEQRLRSVVTDLAGKAGLSPREHVAELCMDWDAVRRLAEDPLVTIGAHTTSHARLAGLSEEKAREEIAASRTRIEASLGRPVLHLAYPFGDPVSAGEREFTLAREAGFASAVTTRTGHLFPEHTGHMHALPRVAISGLFQTRSAVRALLSGIPSLAWNRGRKLGSA